MSALPASTDAAIKKRFLSLKDEGAVLLEKMRREKSISGARGHLGVHVCVGEFQSFQTRALNLVRHLGDDGTFGVGIQKAVAVPSELERMLGTLSGLVDDYENGFLDKLLNRVEAEVAADYLGQAEQLLGEGQPGKFDHVPAAVLLGAVLEKGLRSLCVRQTPPLDLLDSRGKHKMLNVLIDDLKKAGVFNELKAKQLRAWADIRNAAAHGEFDKFTRNDVEQMQTGVATFLADHL